MRDTPRMRVSVIVASHRERTIDNFVVSIMQVVPDLVLTEIIIVADYVIDEYKKKYPTIIWLYVPDKNIPVKRNRGIQAAKGEFCAFIDDDCRPAEKWISEAVQYLDSHPEIAGVEGLTAIEDCDRKVGAYKEFKRLEKRGYRTNNIFYRRDILLDVNLFDERFAFQREDVDLAYSILKSGQAIGYSESINVFHRFRTKERWDLLKNCVNRRFDPLLYKKHKKMYRQFIGTPFPPGISLILMAYMVTIGSALFFSSLTIYLSVMTMLIIFFFTIRRGGFPTPSGLIQWGREYVSFVASPFVLTGALLYGSIRFRQLFLM